VTADLTADVVDSGGRPWTKSRGGEAIPNTDDTAETMVDAIPSGS